MRKTAGTKSRSKTGRRMSTATVSAAELKELKALEQRILAGSAPLVSAETVLRQTLRDLRKSRRA
jgi:hypothetical protein